MSPADKISVLTFVVFSCLIQICVLVDGGRILSTPEAQFQTNSQSQNPNKIDLQDIAATGTSCGESLETRVCLAKTVVGDVYRGVSAKISIHEPRVLQNQSSSARISIKTIGSGNVEHIEAGLMVNPSLNGDNKNRLYIKWTGKDSSSGCYNLDCPGFVINNKDFDTVNIVASPVSEEGGKQYHMFLKISMNSTTGDWWLTGGVEEKALGYWPSKLFEKLGQSESSMDWGGEVCYPKNSTSPQMGSGLLPSLGFGNAAYIRELYYVDEEYKTVSVGDNPDTVVQYSDGNGCYGIGNQVSQSEWGYNFFYGGPGFC